MSRYDHPIAGPDGLHTCAHLLYHPQRLVPKNEAGLGAGAAVEHVQVGATERGRGKAKERIGRLLDARIGNVVYCDPSRALEHDRLHGSPPCRANATTNSSTRGSEPAASGNLATSSAAITPPPKSATMTLPRTRSTDRMEAAE